MNEVHHTITTDGPTANEAPGPIGVLPKELLYLPLSLGGKDLDALFTGPSELGRRIAEAPGEFMGKGTSVQALLSRGLSVDHQRTGELKQSLKDALWEAVRLRAIELLKERDIVKWKKAIEDLKVRFDASLKELASRRETRSIPRRPRQREFATRVQRLPRRAVREVRLGVVASVKSVHFVMETEIFSSLFQGVLNHVNTGETLRFTLVLPDMASVRLVRNDVKEWLSRRFKALAGGASPKLMNEHVEACMRAGVMKFLVADGTHFREVPEPVIWDLDRRSMRTWSNGAWTPGAAIDADELQKRMDDRRFKEVEPGAGR